MAARTTPSRRSGRPPNRAYIELMKPDEDWRNMDDAAERRKIQNRLAQRAYRRSLRDRTREVENLKRQVMQLQSSDATVRGSSRSPSPGLVSSPEMSISGASSDGGRPGTPPHSQTGWFGNDYFPVEVREPEQIVTGLGFVDFDHSAHAQTSLGYHPTMGAVDPALASCHVSPPLMAKRTFSMESAASDISNPSPASYAGTNPFDSFYPTRHSSTSSISSTQSAPAASDALFLTSQNIYQEGMTLPSTTTPTPSGAAYIPTKQQVDPSSLAHYAVSSGDVPALRMLLRDHPISLASTPDSEGMTPLQRAVAMGRTDMVSLFVEAFFSTSAVPASRVRIGVEETGEQGRRCVAVHL